MQPTAFLKDVLSQSRPQFRVSERIVFFIRGPAVPSAVSHLLTAGCHRRGLVRVGDEQHHTPTHWRSNATGHIRNTGSDSLPMQTPIVTGCGPRSATIRLSQLSRR